MKAVRSCRCHPSFLTFYYALLTERMGKIPNKIVAGSDIIDEVGNHGADLGVWTMRNFFESPRKVVF